MKWPIRFLAVLATASFVGAGVDYVCKDSDSPLPPFLVSQTEFALSGVPAGDRELVVHFTNPAKTPRSIIGIREACEKNCCYFSKHYGPIAVGAGETAEYRVLLRVYRKGEFEAEINIYLEENGIRTVTLHVTGTAVEAPRAPK